MESKTVENILNCAELLFHVFPRKALLGRKAKQLTNTSCEVLMILMIMLNTTCSDFF